LPGILTVLFSMLNIRQVDGSGTGCEGTAGSVRTIVSCGNDRQPESEASFLADAISSSSTVAGIRENLSDTSRAYIPGIIPEKPGIIRTFPQFHRREKNPQIALIGGRIVSRSGLYYSEKEKRPVLALRPGFFSDGYRRGFRDCVPGDRGSEEGGFWQYDPGANAA